MSLTVALVLWAAAGASATDTFYEVATGSVGPGLRVQLHVSDGFTQLVALDTTSGPSALLNSDGTAQIVGILDPVWFVRSIELRWTPVAFSGVVGAVSIPWELRLDTTRAHYRATGASPFLTPDGIALYPGDVLRSTTIRDAGIVGHVRGSLVANGTTFVVNSGSADTLLCDACVSGVLTATPAGGGIASFEVTSGEASPLIDTSYAHAGLIWTVKAFAVVHQASMSRLPQTECTDGIDNDGDGLIDFPGDWGCYSPRDDFETRDCEDGIDNDSDGAIDANTLNADPGCNLIQMQKEDPQCSDGIDNDGDSAVDYPADTRCQGAWDDDETADPQNCGLLGIESLALVAWALGRKRRSAAP